MGSSQLPALNVVSPFLLFSSIIYSLYGHGGSLLAIKAKSDFDTPKANRIFTLAVMGCIIACLALMIGIIVFADYFLLILNIPSDIYQSSKTYLLVATGFFVFNAYVQVLGYFLKSDGHAMLTLNAVLIANVLNLALNFILFRFLAPDISSIALALVIGYMAGAVYISRYFFKKDAAFRLVSPRSLSIKDWFYFRSHALVATPELVARVCIVVKTTVIIGLCATYLGDAGLLAFLVYDNVESILFLFVSAMTRSAYPFLTLFYNEQEYPSVEFITKLSVKLVLVFIISISAVFIIFPDILLFLFNITVPTQQGVVSLAIRITCLGLIGRCLSMIISDYAQAISSSKISALINFLREGILPFMFIIILIPQFGGVGIWITLCLADTIPVFAYLAMTLYQKKKYSGLKDSALMIPPSFSFHWTGMRSDFEKMDVDMQESNKKVMANLQRVFGKDYLIIARAMENIAKDIFVADDVLSEIDISVIVDDDYMILRFIYDGELYDPFKNDELLNGGAYWGFKQLQSCIQLSFDV